MLVSFSVASTSPLPSFDPTSLTASYITIMFIFRDFVGAQWRGFTDLGSGLSGFSWRAGTTPGGSDVMPEHPLGLTFSAFTTDLPQLLPEGPTIFVTVTAVDAAGICNYICCLTFSQHVASISQRLILPLVNCCGHRRNG